MRRIITLIAMLLCLALASPALAADTILVGSDGSNYTDTYCWSYPADSLTSYIFRAMRFQALNSGTISYFRKRVGSTPTGCTNDSVMWAIYEAGTSSTVGALKAYGVANNYNWTTIGAGLHDFPVTTTVTDLTVTAGAYYWITYYSYGSDAAHYSNAGCSAQIMEYRGQGEVVCMHYQDPPGTYHMWLDYSVSASRGEPNVDYIPGGTPPAPESYDVPLATYSMWGVWASDAATPPSATGCTISGGSFR